LFKVLGSIADSGYVRRSTIITGVLLAFSAASLAGVGYWVSGGFDNVSAVGSAEGYAAAPWDYNRGHAAGLERVSASKVTPSPSLNEYTIRKTVPEVRLEFTVADERGRLVPDLAESDIRILDDQVPVPRVQRFEKASDLPLRIGLLLDVSDSMKRVMQQEKSVALGFLNKVVRPGMDRAFVMAFGDTVQVWQNPTSDLADLIGAVSTGSSGGDSTDLFDAIHSACVDQWKTTESGLVHRVLVIITDGEDNGSRHILDDVIAAAQRSEIQIYTINVHLKNRYYPGDPLLQRLADETGGRFFIAKSAREADAIFGALEQEMRTQYYVSFRPLRETPGYHALKIEVQPPKKLMVHARSGYYAVNQ
jgi:VWFA-related protein